MFPKEVRFFFEKREIGLPYVLWVKFDCEQRWAIMEWHKEPSEQIIADTKKVFMRSCELYHKHIEMPRFQMQKT